MMNVYGGTTLKKHARESIRRPDLPACFHPTLNQCGILSQPFSLKIAQQIAYDGLSHESIVCKSNIAVGKCCNSEYSLVDVPLPIVRCHKTGVIAGNTIHCTQKCYEMEVNRFQTATHLTSKPLFMEALCHQRNVQRKKLHTCHMHVIISTACRKGRGFIPGPPLSKVDVGWVDIAGHQGRLVEIDRLHDIQTQEVPEKNVNRTILTVANKQCEYMQGKVV